MALTPNQKKATRYLIRRYCQRSVNARPGIHYSQARPMTHLGVAPEKGFTADCSGFATSAFYWSDKYTEKYKVEDPNGLGYNGTGYTGTLLAYNRKRVVPKGRQYFVGDLALYGPTLSYTTHVCICMKNGDADTSEWASHGSEVGPYVVRLHYRSDLLCVVRSKSLA